MAQQSSERPPTVQQSPTGEAERAGVMDVRGKLAGAEPGNLDAILPLMRCPIDGEALVWDRAASELRDTNHVYPIEDAIPLLLAPRVAPGGPGNDVTAVVKDFHEANPFPRYDGIETRESLRQQVRASAIARLLDDQISKSARILDVGCGTGQMTNALAMAWARTVVGCDICRNSLKLAAGFRDRFAVDNAHFVQMNLFDPFFRKHSFDVVIADGVLHHTADAAAAFGAIQELVKPGGHAVIGLYNRFARLPTLWRRSLIHTLGDFAALLDGRLRRERDPGRRQAWLMEQYRHPHETRHSIDEVMDWFERAGFDFVSCSPPIGDRELTEDDMLFEPQPKGTYLDRLSSELEMLLSGGADGGGSYIMIGRKRR
jgi:SAM-dependent methyltransferase